MKRSILLPILLLFVVSACSGAHSEVKKSWKNTENTINIQDLTSKDFQLMDAGSKLQDTLESKIDGTGFIVAGKNARYNLKYKILEFDEGSRLARLATFGISESAKGHLKVKVALFKEGALVGGWVVDSWVKGGFTGGSEKNLFSKAAEEIAGNLKGDY